MNNKCISKVIGPTTKHRFDKVYYSFCNSYYIEHEHTKSSTHSEHYSDLTYAESI
uniref:Uncharacterized protein n=1 Tax=Anguilla anguilla TaxID=7936 RepID=A0A0E9VXJ5_ANGAN